MLSPDNFYSDVSSNNASFNAARYRSSGHRVIAIKATEGQGYTNPDYSGWAHTAHEHGLSVWHYHFARPEHSSPRAEVEHFWHTIQPHFVRPGDFVFFDVETGSLAEARNWLNIADPYMHAITGVHPKLYAPLSYYESAPLSVHSGSYVIAAWGTGKPRLRRGDELTGWQYSGGTNLTIPGGYPRMFAGIPGTPDCNLLLPSLVKYYRTLKK